MKQLHSIQIKILQKLLFSDKCAFSELRINDDIENNKLIFHIKQLLSYGYIAKVQNLYQLTNWGKEYANRIGTNTQFFLQAKISVTVMCTRKAGTEVLLYTRLKHPFYGAQGYLSGKVELGETVFNAASRELKEETNLEGKPILFKIFHETVFDKTTKELLEDKFFYSFIVKDPVGELSFTEEGNFEWIKVKDLENAITKPFSTLERSLKFTYDAIKFNSKNPTFEEFTSFTDEF